MTVLAVILGALCLLLLLPVGIRAVFDGSLSVYLTVFHVPFRIYPGRSKEKLPKKQSKEEPKAKNAKGKGNSLSDFDQYLKLLTKLLGKVRKKLLLRELTLHAVCGGKEPELNYGRGWAFIGSTMPILEQLFRIRKRDIGAYLSPEEPSVRIYARAHATMSLGHLLHLAYIALRDYLKIKHKPKKAVQEHE